MKFLVVSDFLENANSGAAGSLITIGQNLEQLGHEVDYVWQKDKKYINISNLNRFTELPFIQYFQLRNALKQKRYDVVIVSQPHVWFAFQMLKSKFRDTLFINRSHGWELRIESLMWTIEEQNPVFIKKLKHSITLLLLKHCSFYTVKYSDAVICASSDDTGFIKQAYPQFKDKITTITYGLDDSYIGLQLKRKEAHPLKYLFAGQYIKRKGIEDLKHVFKKMIQSSSAPFELTFIVDGYSIAAVENDFNFLPPGYLQISPWLSRTMLIDKYKDSDVFLMASYGEGFGKTSIEAMACGLCVIGYREGALTDIGQNELNCLIGPKGDTEELFSNIQKAAMDPELTYKLGRKAYDDVQAKTWMENAVQTAAFVNKLKAN